MEPKPALVRLKQKGERPRWLFFENHNDALTTILEARASGQYTDATMQTVEVYREGELPQLTQPKLFKSEE